MFRWSLIVLVLVAVTAGLAVGALNPDSVRLDLAIFSVTLPLGALVLAALAGGVLLGLILGLILFLLPARLGRARRSTESTRGTGLTDPHA